MWVLAERLVAYLQLLVVPLMGRISDALPSVCRLAAPAFAAVVALVPLAQAGAGCLPRLRAQLSCVRCSTRELAGSWGCLCVPTARAEPSPR